MSFDPFLPRDAWFVPRGAFRHDDGRRVRFCAPRKRAQGVGERPAGDDDHLWFDFVERVPHFATDFVPPLPVAGIAFGQRDAREGGRAFNFVPSVSVLPRARFHAPDRQQLAGGIQARVMIRAEALEQNRNADGRNC